MLAPSENDLPQVGDTIAAKYRIEEILGRGGMGAVFRVTHAVTGKSFAVKWLLPHLNTGPETAQRFIREAQVAGRVDHPNVVEVYDIGEDRGSMYMVMELLHGESLAQHLVRVGRVPHSQACELLIGVARGLAAAHRSGVIHRDLKPDNIFLSVSTADSQREPRPKVLDFGISKISALATEANPALTREGVVMGTPHYMAPEQLRSHKLDERCDVYALGVILYQLLSGKLPFVGDNFPDLMLKIVGETPAALANLAPEAPPELIAIVETAMSRSAAERFDSAADFGRALEPFAEGATFDVAQPSTLRPASARPPSSILPAATTPVATESRFPPTDGQPVNALQRARRLTVPLAASVVSAALVCWIYVSFDNQKSALHAASEMKLERPEIAAADSSKSLRRTSPTKSAPAKRAEPQSHLGAASSTGAGEPDVLPEPHVTALPELDKSKPAAPQQVSSLIGAGGLPVTTPAAADTHLPAASSGAENTGAIAAPSPVPPPGAAALPETNIAPSLKAHTEAKTKKLNGKKPETKFESPELRMNDFL